MARLSETAIAFARSCARGVETVIAFSGEKWAFLVQFSAALVLLVSMVAVQGRAVVMMVPCWPASVAAEVSLVASSPRGCVLCAKKFALRGLMVGASAKSSPCARKMAQNRRFMACWANFFAEESLKGLCWAKFFAEMPLEARCRANFFAGQQSRGPAGRVRGT